MSVRPKLVVLFAATAMLASACTSSTDSTTTAPTTVPVPSTTSTSTTTTTTTTTEPPDPRLAEPLPVDDGVMVGQLDNGLTYYVRENFRPGDRAELRLVVNAGSAQEAADQSGGAHFLEHMLFNGTERFPANELTRVLEGFGARFGPDVNAYTSFDETVYELSVATDDPALLDLALDVLLEWAAKAAIEQSEVENERGVVLEEWRLRSAGLNGRIAQAYEDVLLRGTGYEGQAPIGDPEQLEVTNAAELRRFYEDWYRPDLMAVVAVGDFDADTVVAAIEERFSTIEARTGPDRAAVEVAPFEFDRVRTLADADQPNASVEIYYPTPSRVAETYGDRKDGWALLVANDMLATRLNDDVTRGDAPFLSVSATDFDYTRGLQVTGLSADVSTTDVIPAIADLVMEVERALRHGYSESEFDRAIAGWTAAVEQFYNGRNSTQDVEYAGRYVNNFLAGSPILSAQDDFDIDSAILDSLTPEDAVAALEGLVGASSRVTVVIGPSDGSVPDNLTIETAIALALAGRIVPRDDDEAIGDTLLAAPLPVAPVAENELPLGITELVYPNGVRVQYLETDISANQLVMGARSPGGLSRVADDDVVEGSLAADVVARSGAGVFDRVALETFLADKFVFVAPYIDVVEEGLFGSAASEDLETMFQLIHLQMVAPRLDDAATATVLQEIRPFAESPGDIPGLATTIEVISQRWGGEPRYRVLPTPAELDEYDPAAAARVLTDRFGNAGDFVFSFAGDFDSAELRGLADEYLGTLPSTDRDDSVVDYQQDPPSRIIDETIAVGESEQGFVTFLFTNELMRDPLLDIQLELLSLISDVKLRDRIREALAATYTPFLSVSSSEDPDDIVETFLQVSGDPEELDQIVDEALAVLQILATDGPTDDELATAREQLGRQYELVSNEWWVDRMLFYSARPDEMPDSLFDVFTLIDQTTTDDLRSLAATTFPLDSYVLVRQIPE